MIQSLPKLITFDEFLRFIGQPKQPTLSLYQLIDKEYQVQQFRGKDLINKSLIFPELSLTVEQVFQAQ